MGAVHRIRHQGGYRHRATAGNHIGRLQTGEFNDVAHQRGEATRLLVQATHKVLNRLRVIASLLNRLREQTHRAHRCLQLVRHVRHKVITHALHARNFGAVIGEHQDVFVAQGGHANVQDQRLPLAAVNLKALLSKNTAVTHRANHISQLGRGNRVPSHQTHRVGARRGLHNSPTSSMTR